MTRVASAPLRMVDRPRRGGRNASARGAPRLGVGRKPGQKGVMTVLLLAFLMGIVAGLRTFMAPAAVSWAAHRGAIDVEHGPLAFMGYRFTPWIFTLLAAF